MFDQSRCQIDVIFWGDYVSMLNVKVKDKVFIKSLNISSLNGFVTGTVSSNSMVIVNPDIGPMIEDIRRFNIWSDKMPEKIPTLRNISLPSE